MQKEIDVAPENAKAIVMEPHRMAIEPRSGIWLVFYEILLMRVYEQELLEISNSREEAEKIAYDEKIARKIYTPTIVRGDGEKDKMNRR